MRVKSEFLYGKIRLPPNFLQRITTYSNVYDILRVILKYVHSVDEYRIIPDDMLILDDVLP